jgi:hypothetical protein
MFHQLSRMSKKKILSCPNPDLYLICFYTYYIYTVYICVLLYIYLWLEHFMLFKFYRCLLFSVYTQCHINSFGLSTRCSFSSRFLLPARSNSFTFFFYFFCRLSKVFSNNLPNMKKNVPCVHQ